MSIAPQEYEDLVEKLFDDRLMDDELERLNEVLRASSDARDHYWHLVMLEGYLADLPGWVAGQQYATQLAFSETLEAFIEMESNAQATLLAFPPVSDASEVEVEEKAQVTWADARAVAAFAIRSLARQRATWGVAAAAVICIAALAYATWFRGDASRQVPEPIAASTQQQQQPSVTPPAVELALVAVVRNRLNSSRGTSVNALSPGMELAQGHIIDLQANDALQLALYSGVSVILQGPGEFELLKPNSVGMQRGRLTAIVPPQAKGFTVATPQTDFIDHGTEFAIALDETGHGEVAVLDGLVEAKQATPLQQGDPDLAPSIMLREGIGGRLVPDEALPASVQPIDQQAMQRYAREWDDVAYKPHLSGQIQYVTSPPASLDAQQTTSSMPLLIPERRGVVLTEDLHLNSTKQNRSIINKRRLQVDADQDYVIPSGTRLNSFLIHFDISNLDKQGIVERDFELAFSGRIIAIVQVSKYQYETDDLLGLASIHYPEVGSLRGAADPPDNPNHDVIHVSNDLHSMAVKMRLSGMDQVRVLVENTDP